MHKELQKLNNKMQKTEEKLKKQMHKELQKLNNKMQKTEEKLMK